MTKVTILLLIILQTTSFVQDKSYKPKYQVILDDSKGEKLLRQCSRSTPQNIKSYWTLHVEDVDKLEKSYLKILDVVAEDCCQQGGTIKHIENFAYQYVGIMIDGRKYIYINAFKVNKEADLDRRYPGWKSNPIIVCDGGQSFWGILFNLETSEFSNLAINGFA